MSKMPQEVKEFIPNKMGWVGTATKDGVPNVTAKGSVQILDDEHLIFADLFSRKTRENLENNPQVSITVIDEKSFKGYQIKGSAELLTTGAVYDKVVEELKQAPMELPEPKYVVKITVNSVYDQSVGPDAGKRIV
jgi:predicted pyridoxine 5'-phosphate oxidase superfamily flavin-nucleotide-binding protein